MSTVSEEAVRREVGRRIAQFRDQLGMTQGDLAERLGVTRAKVSHWERGFHAPSLAQLIDLGKVLDTRIDRLLLGDFPEPPREPGLSSVQFERLARHLQGLNEIVTAAQKGPEGMKKPQPAIRRFDAGPRANSGRGF
ncbi:MAG TPA: helix-turn-helix transcriptional regulator [Thermoanaerobaculia bacterium]|nr:helix-turn-helix transcriptional regulator [Thermoanaerobaculia bacterium]